MSLTFVVNFFQFYAAEQSTFFRPRHIVNRNSFAVATDPAGAGAGIDSERAELRRRGRRLSSTLSGFIPFPASAESVANGKISHKRVI